MVRECYKSAQEASSAFGSTTNTPTPASSHTYSLTAARGTARAGSNPTSASARRCENQIQPRKQRDFHVWLVVLT